MERRLLYIGTADAHIAKRLFDGLENWEVCQVATLAEATQALRKTDVIVGLLDGIIGTLRVREIDHFLRVHSRVHWVGIVNGIALASDACRDLIADHLYDYHSEPVDVRRLAHTLGHAHGWATIRRPRPRVPDSRQRQIGSSDAMIRLREHVERVARTAAPVLIWGESGSGKELAAQAIHEESPRARAPFIAVNCGAIAPSLIQSELFGYEKGAFTGAAHNKTGLLEAANGGTIFLDEIADLPKELQANLLRFLQEKTITRLGATRATPLDVRVIAASHVNLREATVQGTFREDLYYRLAVLPIRVPPLRERREDLMLLADHFFQVYGHEKNPRVKGFSCSAINAILAHDWPGNVRELMNRVRRAMVMAEGRLIGDDDLGFVDPLRRDVSVALDDTLMQSEKQALVSCLERSRQNISLAARELGISRTTMYRLLSKHGIRL